MGGTEYFFPMNADPYYHELPTNTVGWINNLYGVNMAAEFDAQNITYFQGRSFDLFFCGFGDSFPSVAFHAAGSVHPSFLPFSFLPSVFLLSSFPSPFPTFFFSFPPPFFYVLPSSSTRHDLGKGSQLPVPGENLRAVPGHVGQVIIPY
jgi:hypothetical protein